MRPRAYPWFRDGNERPFRVAADAAARQAMDLLLSGYARVIWVSKAEYLSGVADVGLGFCENCGSPLQPTSSGKSQCRKCGYLDTCCDRVP